MNFLDLINAYNGWLWGSVLIFLLLGAGVYFTVASRGLQFRMFGHMAGVLRRSARDSDNAGISGFQAFATTLANRVGTGNIAGVALAITIGGPGAVFWMWVVGLLGMATAFAESVLAQVYKVPGDEPGMYRGGPATYIRRGLNWAPLAAFMAVLTAFTHIIAFGPVQSNSMSAALEHAYGVPTWATGLAIASLAGLVIIGGIRRIAKVAEVVVPVMATVYLGIAGIVLVMCWDQIPAVVGMIVGSALGIQQIAGAGAGIMVAKAVDQGIRRGLFSNEAGLGTAPNAAATASVKHPVTQGLMQSFGVFVDTLLVATATAFMILLSGVYVPGQEAEGVTLTQNALGAVIGPIGPHLIALALMFFGFTSIIAIAYYGETNLVYLGVRGRGLIATRIFSVGMVFVGSVTALSTVWNVSDAALGTMAITNLVAILLLSPVVFRLLRDYERQRKAGIDEPTFDPAALPRPIRGVHPEVWPAGGSTVETATEADATDEQPLATV